MSKYLPKLSSLMGLSLSIPSILVTDVARSQSNRKVSPSTLPTAEEINKKIQQNYPPELLGESTATPNQPAEVSVERQTINSTKSPQVPSINLPSNSNHTAIGTSTYTFILPTPALIAAAVLIGGIALFPVVHLLFNSKKAAEIGKNSILSKLMDRFQKPKVLESDVFLHQRNFDKITQIAAKAEKLDADKFGNTEFMEFFKIKSYIARSMGEYANLDEIVELFNVAIGAQASFSAIDSIESRNCSTNQQEFYKFVLTLLAQGVELDEFSTKIDLKLQEILPRLKTEEGRVAVEAYKQESIKIAKHPLAVKLLLLFKKYQLDDYSILRSVANTLNLLEAEDLLNLDSLLLLVMTKYEIFEKLGPIVGVSEENNRPETYSKMLQYIGLKARHEVSYQKFQEFLVTLKQWDVHNQTIVNLRQKYNAKEYRLPKNFTAELPGEDMYEKYKDSFHLITQPTNPQQKSHSSAIDIPVLSGVK